MGLLNAIVKTTAIIAAEKFGESAIESIAKHSSNVIASQVGNTYVSVPRSAEDIRGEDYEEIKRELEAYGFKNINLLEKKDLRKNWFTKIDNRKITEISINGKTDFKKKARFLCDAQVVIVYRTFKD